MFDDAVTLSVMNILRICCLPVIHVPHNEANHPSKLLELVLDNVLGVPGWHKHNTCSMLHGDVTKRD